MNYLGSLIVGGIFGMTLGATPYKLPTKLGVLAFWLIGFTMLLQSCTTAPVVENPPKKEYPVSGWGQAYDLMAENAIRLYGKELIAASPKDGKEWCQNFETVDKVVFYTRLLSAISKRESGWNASQTYKEKFKNGAGEIVVSTGLVQVSYESCRSYGVTGVTTEQLKDPMKNLECAVKILNRWIPRDGYVAKDKLGAGRYWSVMRPGDSKEYIKGNVQELCK